MAALNQVVRTGAPDMSDATRIQRAFAARSFLRQRQYAEQLERIISGAIAARRNKCKCGACRYLRALKQDLEQPER